MPAPARPPLRGMPGVLWVSLGLHALSLAAFLARPGRWRGPAAAVALNHAFLMLAAFRPRSRLLGPNPTRLPDAAARRGEIGLTFDDGPHPDITPRVLDILDAFSSTASFFCVGERARRHPDLTRAICRRGHSVENHTESHRYDLALRGPAAMRRDIRKADHTLLGVTGTKPRFFRAPAGIRSPLLDPVLAREDLIHVSWTRRGFDWADGSPERVVRRLLRGLRPGDILVLHDGASARAADGRPVVLAVLPELLAALRDRGLRAVSLPAAFA
ncbi:MAG: polysaccharide deacetylase family protein [Acetobacteraceae bacterium]|nr:polysaccharide deacetylase family protein [Acetobacteraceae bacterium]